MVSRIGAVSFGLRFPMQLLNLRRATLIVAVSLALVALWTPGRVHAAASGVRHILMGSLSFGGPPASAPRQSASGAREREGATADIQTDVRISDHAPGVDFYGVITTRFSDVRWGQQTAEQTIWEATKCHFDRGLPKVSVLGFRGDITHGDTSTRVMATPRQIGKLVPDDEILTTRRVPAGLNRDGAELLIQAVTKTSELALSLRLVVKYCDL
ncbi:hypothetical protein RHPLAN_53500 [Rhodoplanes sp. Z2-YC6860]|nr:hypothetical protein RHPLAN_53500 [Rhodoplanes sp. Z2-YC6860]